jgi:hypothetical protein
MAREPRHTPAEHHPSPEYFGEAGLYRPGDHMMGGADRFGPVPDSEHGELKGSRDNQHPPTGHDDTRYFSHVGSGTEGKDVHAPSPQSAGLGRIETDGQGYPIHSHSISHGGSLNADRIRRGREPV